MESAWFAFRAEALKQIARNWCEANHIVGMVDYYHTAAHSMTALDRIS